MAKTRKIASDRIVLNWTCPICSETFKQALTSMPASGTAICPDCDCDCDLDEQVEVNPVYIVIHPNGLFWNNTQGWIDNEEGATIFSQQDREGFYVPCEGEWKEI